MTDIVERARHDGEQDDCVICLRIKIKQLRGDAELDARLRTTALTLRDEARQENKTLRAEIERLRAKVMRQEYEINILLRDTRK